MDKFSMQSLTSEGNRIFKTFCFLLGFILGFSLLQSLFTLKFPQDETANGDHFVFSDIWKEYKEIEKNTIDVLFLGPSTVYNSVSPLRIYNKSEITSFVLATPGQPMQCSYYILEEALKTQNPEIVFLEVTEMVQNDIDWQFYLEVFNAFPPSFHKCKALFYILGKDYKLREGIFWERFWGALFPFGNYHNRWQELTNTDFGNNILKKEFCKGYFPNPSKGVPDINVEEMNNIADAMKNDSYCKVEYYNGEEFIELDHEEDRFYNPELDENSMVYVHKIKELCLENGVELVLFKVPSISNPVWKANSWIYDLSNDTREYAIKEDLLFLDLLYDQDLGIDWANDSMDSGVHLNTDGARKVTDFLADYIEANYHISQKNFNYSEDGIKYHELESVFSLMSESSLYDYLHRIYCFPSDLEIILTVCEDISQGMTKEENDILRDFLGLKSDFYSFDYADTYVALIRYVSRDKKFSIEYEEHSNREIKYEYEMDDESKICVVSRGGYQFANASVTINEVEYIDPYRGLNIVVYNPSSMTVIDSVNFDFGNMDNHNAFRNDYYIWRAMRDYQNYLVESN